jgi:hypothetical protein
MCKSTCCNLVLDGLLEHGAYGAYCNYMAPPTVSFTVLCACVRPLGSPTPGHIPTLLVIVADGRRSKNIDKLFIIFLSSWGTGLSFGGP